MRKFLSIFFALVLCVSAMVVIASAATNCPEHDWSAWTTIEILDDGTIIQSRSCACLATETQTIEPPHKHIVEHVDAVAPTCEADGNVEYWYCTDCGYAWLDAEMTLVSNLKSVKLGATHTLEHVEAKDATCLELGNIEYWACKNCDRIEVAGGVLSNIKAVQLPTLDHTIEHVAAVATTCTTDGNVEYWYCTTCGYAWLDEARTQVTNLQSVKLGAAHALVHVEAKAATCLELGNIEYWYCSNCDYVEVAGGVLSNIKAVQLPTLDHTIEHVAAKAAACESEGNVEYWYCTVCGYAWLDEARTLVSNLQSVKLGAAHTLVKVDAKAATCTENGNIEYWYCSACDWVEVAGGVASNLKAVQTPAAHSLVKVDAKAATCFELGNIEYWYCSACDWVEVAGGVASNLKAVVLPIVHNIEHVAAKAATATENGNIEHWYCKDCGYAWLDELCTKNTNLKAVVLPATGEEPTNPKTGDNAIFFVVAIVAVATLGVAAVSFKKREN